MVEREAHQVCYFREQQGVKEQRACTSALDRREGVRHSKDTVSGLTVWGLVVALNSPHTHPSILPYQTLSPANTPYSNRLSL